MGRVHLDPQFMEVKRKILRQYDQDYYDRFTKYQQDWEVLREGLYASLDLLRKDVYEDLKAAFLEAEKRIEQEESNDQEETQDADGAHAEG